MKPQLARSLIQQAAMFLFVGDNAKTEELSLAARDIFRQLGDRRGEAEITGNLGVLANRKNEPRRALEYFEQALPNSSRRKRLGTGSANPKKHRFYI